MGKGGSEVTHVEHPAAGRAFHEVLFLRGIDLPAGNRILQPAEEFALGTSAMGGS
jgi:hypothetical protein